MSDTFDHAGQAYDSWEAEVGHGFFGNPDPTFGFGFSLTTNNHSSEKSQILRDGYFGQHKISGMTHEHCKNAIKYILRTNKGNESKYRSILKQLNGRIKDSTGEAGYALVNKETGEIEEF